MKEHFCPAEQSTITYQGKCNWCGESEEGMTQEALKLALEALEETREHIAKHRRLEAITAIKEALAQIEQDGKCKYCTDGCPACDARKLPAQRTWVGLTDEELKKTWYAMQNIMGWYSFQEISEAIEAKLKEKNT